MTQIRTTLIAVLGLPVLAACTNPPRTAVDALPDDAGAHATEVAQLRDGLAAMDSAGTVIPGNNAPTPTVAGGGMAAPVILVDGQPLPQPTDATSATAETPYMISGLGFAQIANQPGATVNQKRLMALRAARMDALRDLTEQVHGIRISASTTVGEARVINDSLSATVDGTIRGARTVRITPKGADGYEVELALDADTVAYIVRAAQGRL